jgi:hypothetical protein
MTMKTILATAEKFVTDNSPGILTGLGVAGTVTTVVLVGHAAYQVGMDASTQYHEAVKEDELLPEELLETKHLVKTYWKSFIPAMTVGAATIGTIIMANQIGARRAAAITAAYKKKVVETLGLQKEEKMRSEHAGEKIAANPPSSMIIVSGSDVLMYDEFSGRYFMNEIDKVRKAVNEINYKVNNYFFASLTDFYELIGLPATKFSEEVGWNTDELLEVQYTATMYDDKPAVAISYNTAPTRSYDRCQ